MSIKNMNYLEIKGCIVDEIHLRERTDASVNLSSTKDTWQVDTYLLAKFLGNLEAGNVANEGVEIVQFAIKRRKLSEFQPITLGYLPYVEDRTLEFIDYTQSNDSFIYSIVPMGTNGLEGRPQDISIESDFAGWFIYDKDTNKTLSFDTFIGSASNVDTVLNQGRTQIDTFSRFPRIVYTDQEYHTFSISTVIIPEEWERSGNNYDRVLNDFIRQRKPFLVKGSNGEVYVCDVSNPRKSTPQNTYKSYDYIQLTVDLVEIMTYDDYLKR